jgi:uncharacterized protein
VENRISYNRNLIILLYIAVIGFIIFNVFRLIDTQSIDFSVLENFSTIFISIILEAIPFILLGAIVSALIQVFVSEETIAKIIPKNKVLGFVAASLMGFIFPVCECAIIPIAKRLIKKGLPLGFGVTFMLAVPIANPVVLLSTYYAFQGNPSVVIMRGGFAILAAITVGVLISIVEGDNPSPLRSNDYALDGGCYCGCGNNNGLYKYQSKFRIILDHTTREFLSISKYLILGAFISGVFQTIISRSLIASVGNRPMASIAVMMMLAFTLSICSEADAFIASSFMSQFTIGSILGFLLLGPMVDIKNAFMIFGNFKGKVAAKFIVYIVLVIFIITSYTNVISLLGVI